MKHDAGAASLTLGGGRIVGAEVVGRTGSSCGIPRIATAVDGRAELVAPLWICAGPRIAPPSPSITSVAVESEACGVAIGAGGTARRVCAKADLPRARRYGEEALAAATRGCAQLSAPLCAALQLRVLTADHAVACVAVQRATPPRLTRAARRGPSTKPVLACTISNTATRIAVRIPSCTTACNARREVRARCAVRLRASVSTADSAEAAVAVEGIRGADHACGTGGGLITQVVHTLPVANMREPSAASAGHTCAQTRAV